MNEILLNGKITRADLEQFPWFGREYAQYKVNDTAKAALLPHVKDLKVMLVMGTWCGDSKEHVPAFYKVADAIGLPASQIDMIAVDRKKQCASVDISSLHIDYVPTFFVFMNGRLHGRIVETPRENIEKDLLHLIDSIQQ
jgi:thiol-disulfide isomerase/thioredoxin